MSTNTHAVSTRAKIDQLNIESEQRLRISIPDALELAQRAEQLAANMPSEVGDYVEGIVSSRINQGFAFLELGNFSEALSLGNSAESLTEQLGNQALRSSAFGVIATAYFRLTNYPKAFDFAQRQLLAARECHAPKQQADASILLGGISAETGALDDAVKYTESALAILRSDDTLATDYFKLSSCNNSLSIIYGMLSQPEKALEYGLEAIKYAEHLSISYFAAVQLAIASAYAKLGNFQNAIARVQIAIDSLGSEKNAYFRSVAHYDHADISFQQGDLDTAEKSAQFALQLATESENPGHQAFSHELLSRIAEQRGKFELALTHHKAYYAIKTKTAGADNMRQLGFLRASYEVEVAQLESELAHLRTEELEAIVEERTQALQMAYNREHVIVGELENALQQAQAFNSLTRKITRTVSHEFRTPLTIVSNSAYLLSNRSQVLTDEKRQQLGTRISNAVTTISDLLHEMLMVETTSAQALEVHAESMQLSDLNRQLADYLKTMKDSQERFNLVVSERSDVTLTTDWSLISQLLDCVFSNALKFSATDSPIDITTNVDETTLQIAIRDYGIGVPTHEQDAIFDLLYRGENRGGQSGVGLGLYIARAIAEALGGTLAAESDGLGQGAQFTLTLPLNRVQLDE